MWQNFNKVLSFQSLLSLYSLVFGMLEIASCINMVSRIPLFFLEMVVRASGIIGIWLVQGFHYFIIFIFVFVCFYYHGCPGQLARTWTNPMNMLAEFLISSWKEN